MIRYRSIVIINISAFLMMLGIGMIVALLPQRIINLSDSAFNVGYLASAFALTFVLFQIPIGNFSDRFGFKPFLVGGYFLCSVTGLLYYFSESSNLIFLGRMLQGIGEVPVWTLAPAFLSIQYPAQKGKVMGIYNASLHCGLTAGSLLGIISYRTWQDNEAFLLFSGMSLFSGLLIALLVKNQKQKSISKTSKINLGMIMALMGNLTNQTVLVGVALYGAGYGIFISIIPAFLISVKNCNQTVVCMFFAVFYIAISLSQLIAGPFSDRKGRKPTMIYGLTLAAIGIASFLAFKLPVLIGLLTLAAFGLGAFCVAAMAFLSESVSNSLKGTISGAFYFSWGAGYFFGPLILEKIGKMGFILFAGFFMIEIVACLLVIKNPSEMSNIEIPVKMLK